MFTLNKASEKKLSGVQPAMQKLVRRAAEISGQPFQVVQGNRTQAEQNALYNQGRYGNPGPIVTWTKNSKHIGGRAIDFAALSDGKINWETISLYVTIANAFKQASRELNIPINWGGDWQSKDWGHVELQKGVPSGVPTETYTPEPYSAIEPLLKKGSKGPKVNELQALLNNQGASLNRDGDFGNLTLAAVVAFQTNHGLKGDGLVGPLTWGKLKAPLTPMTSPSPSDGWIEPGNFTASPFAYVWARTFESYRSKAYDDAGSIAIGYGHNASSGIPPIPKKGDEWTIVQAETALVADMEDKVHYLNAWIKVPLKQSQIDALALDMFQQGPGNFKRSGLLAELNTKAYSGASLMIRNRNTPLSGLRRRYSIIAEIFDGKKPNPEIW